MHNNAYIDIPIDGQRQSLFDDWGFSYHSCETQVGIGRLARRAPCEATMRDLGITNANCSESMIGRYISATHSMGNLRWFPWFPTKMCSMYRRNPGGTGSHGTSSLLVRKLRVAIGPSTWLGENPVRHSSSWDGWSIANWSFKNGSTVKSLNKLVKSAKSS